MGGLLGANGGPVSAESATSLELETGGKLSVATGLGALADAKSNGLSDVGLGKAGGTSSTFRFDCDLISNGTAADGIAVTGIAVTGIAVTGIAVTGIAVTGIAVLDAMGSLESDFEPWVFRITKRHNAITSKPTAVLYTRLLVEGARVFIGFETKVAAAGVVASLAGDVGTTSFTAPTLGVG